MKILVHFKSGFKQTFIVPKCMLALEFRNMAKEIGGNIASIEFSLPSRRQANMAPAELRQEVFRLPEER
ncbi:hypothetical protein [Nitrosomonas ureae]|uniref:Uncharacterized protein n=1 Tax=Nitrosomonas ureae TaxID=44577 RepID=A0A0S3AG73_9PROT|nr:hypothetical protein [Nitrosomonas ureae]ALQ50185.1 hypothetical protein ATY38_02430 [Nitrosomonas ureae]PTQ88764.1 hypothetical protein C8R28_1001156 [Nitrosomonas ureae]PXX18281.1 hypothetical protein C8R27_1011 [Nitrosomonas ureae]SDT85265.1 hypothetical protein SAMN05216406_10441 [Nitrosomonas ureae]SEQ21420.1 hypothetical protein SAMN05421510_102812 [Nitrosomonas ureae]